MKVGLLECDHVREELTYIAGDYREMFPALFLQVAPDWDFRFYDVCNNQFPASVDECDVYICTGSRFSVYDDEEWILKLKNFVRKIAESQQIYIGVCFGHQMLGEALGGVVRKSDAGWCVGVHEFEVTESQRWMSPFQNTFSLLMMCQDQVIDLPPGSRVIARSKDCPNAMILVNERILGIQAHPEFPKVYDKALMELRIDRMGKEKVASGIASLDRPTDELLFAQWIKNYVDALISSSH